MDFRTKIEINRSNLRITHKGRYLMLGSCFAENIGRQLVTQKFNVDVNPFGIVYNPLSAAEVLRLLSGKHVFTQPELIRHNELYASLMHHGQFSDEDPAACLEKINGRALAAARLEEASVLMVTFGTAYTYLYKENGQVVSNCHKLPASLFERRRLSVDEIVDTWTGLIETLTRQNREMRILFTVSPVRHWKDGAHENQLSKSILLLAIEELQRQFPEKVSYFPAYELILDELRDYRFYDEDMIHPNATAIAYCWSRFADTYFDDTTQEINAEWADLMKAAAHRPFRQAGAAHQQFLQKTAARLAGFQARHPYIDCSTEIGSLNSRMITRT